MYDSKTQSAIGYWPSAGADSGYTQAGTWVSYNDAKSMAAITKYTLDNKLGGLFIFDTSMDTQSGAWLLCQQPARFPWTFSPGSFSLPAPLCCAAALTRITLPSRGSPPAVSPQVAAPPTR